MEFNNWRNQMLNNTEEVVRQRVRLNRNNLINDPNNENLFWDDIADYINGQVINDANRFFNNDIVIFAEVIRENELNPNRIQVQNQDILPRTIMEFRNRIIIEAIQNVRNHWLNTNQIP